MKCATEQHYLRQSAAIKTKLFDAKMPMQTFYFKIDGLPRKLDFGCSVDDFLNSTGSMTIAFVTANDPHRFHKNAKENQSANDRLLALLESLHVKAFPLTTRTGKNSDQPIGYAPLDVAYPQARDIARAHKQTTWYQNIKRDQGVQWKGSGARQMKSECRDQPVNDHRTNALPL